MPYDHDHTAEFVAAVAAVVEDVTGMAVDPIVVASALNHRLPARWKAVARVPLSRFLDREHHQRLLDKAAALRFRGRGPDGMAVMLHYHEVYPAYVASARSAGYVPLSLKTFMNRANYMPRRP